MHSFGTMLKATRSKAVEIESERCDGEFESRFGLRSGDWIEVNRGHGWQPARILMAECCYYNARGGFTAKVKLATLTKSGHISTSRGVFMTVNANGGGLRGLGYGQSVRRVSAARGV